jgi:chromosome partitioning protein
VTVPVVGFFSNRKDVGTTTLVYHLGWMYAELGLRVLLVDLDPQSDLSSALLSEEALEDLGAGARDSRTIFGAMRGPVREPYLATFGDHLPGLGEQVALIAGDIRMTFLEVGIDSDLKGESWDKRDFEWSHDLWTVVQQGVKRHQADVVLYDLGPGLGHWNRAVLMATDHVCFPVRPAWSVMRAMNHSCLYFHHWSFLWEIMGRDRDEALGAAPPGHVQPVGYVILQPALRLDPAGRNHERWSEAFPGVYRSGILGGRPGNVPPLAQDPHRIATIRSYESLAELGREARKPVFALQTADGALGSHLAAVHSAYEDYQRAASEIADRIGLTLPD